MNNQPHSPNWTVDNMYILNTPKPNSSIELEWIKVNWT
jgi:hypothetical protein